MEINIKVYTFFINVFFNSTFPLIKDYHSTLQSSLSLLITVSSFCYIWSPVRKKIPNHLFYAKDITEVKERVQNVAFIGISVFNGY